MRAICSRNGACQYLSVRQVGNSPKDNSAKGAILWRTYSPLGPGFLPRPKNPHFSHDYCALTPSSASDGLTALSGSILLPTDCKSCRMMQSAKSVVCLSRRANSHGHAHHHPGSNQARSVWERGSRNLARNSATSSYPWRPNGRVGIFDMPAWPGCQKATMNGGHGATAPCPPCDIGDLAVRQSRSGHARPHPEERASRASRRMNGTSRATWFETRGAAALLTMRV